MAGQSYLSIVGNDRKTQITMRDIAIRLNITASTVSRALNNHPKISNFTKQAVLKMARELNYQPHHIAAALRNGKSGFIGVVIPTADRAFFASIVRGAEEIANNLGYKVIVCQSYDEYEKEVQTLDALFSARVDGIIASIGKNTIDFSHFRRAVERRVPLLLFDRPTEELEVSQVTIDDHLGAYQVVEHLIKQGCKRIGHFTSFQKTSVFKERLRGYQDALRDYGIPYEEEMVVESDLQLVDGRKSMEKLLSRNQIPDAIFSSSDYGAMGAMQVLKERKIKIPTEVALAGFSNDPFTAFTDPPLTTVDQLSKTMGNIVARLFFEELNSHNNAYPIAQKVVLKPEVIIRESSLKKEVYKNRALIK